MFDHEIRTQIANDRFEQLRAAALTPGIPLRQTVGELLIRAGAANEALIAAALTKDEKRQLNALLRRLMREFERREQSPS